MAFKDSFDGAPEPGHSTIERMLGIEFSSDPRASRFPLPDVPAGAPEGIPWIESGFVLTPEIAKDWLTHRVIRQEFMPKALVHDDVIPNRKFLIQYVKTWRKKLENGEWNRGTHQGAAFTPDGFLLDCQHRMAACVLSGIPIILPVAVNTPWSAFLITDDSRRRAPDQMIGELPYSKLCTSIARYLLPALQGSSKTEWSPRGFNEDIVNICLGWPQFSADAQLTHTIHTISREARIPGPPLGAVCIGALAAGADPFEVQAFLDALRPYAKVEFETIGTDGEDPRRLIGALFAKENRSKDSRGRFSNDDQRSHAGTLRRAMTLWLNRNTDDREKVKTMQPIPKSRDLPPMWNEEGIRAFHEKNVN